MQGEMSALLNLARVLGGFSVTYFQVPWALKHGALQVFGCEAAVVAALFLLVVPVLQWKGRALRVSNKVGFCMVFGSLSHLLKHRFSL